MAAVEAPVEQCIAAIISALDGGASTLQLIRKRKGKKKWKKDVEKKQEYGEETLQQALTNAARACRQARDTHSHEFGGAFAFGDGEAAAALGRLQTSLQNQIIGSIQSAGAKEHTVLDTVTLNEAVITMKNNVIRSMDELCHRLSHGIAGDQYTPVQRAEPSRHTALGNARSSLSDHENGRSQDPQQLRASIVPQWEPTLQRNMVVPSRRDDVAHDRSSSIWSSTASSGRSASASTFSFESTAPSHSDFPELFETADDHHRAGVAPQIVTKGYEPMLSSRSPRSSLTRWSSTHNVVSAYAAHREPYVDSPMAVLDEPDHIWVPLSRPARHNDYHGFCKGAWQTRQSMQEGLSIHMLTNNRGTDVPHWKCKQCQFQAKATSETTSLPDSIYFDEKHAIRYRWTFLAKSHVPAQIVQDHSDLYTFGCIVCAAQGSRTAVYQDLKALLEHISSKHKTAMLTPEVLQKTKCIVGGAPDGKGDWDLNVPESGDKNWSNVAGRLAVMALTGIR